MKKNVTIILLLLLSFQVQAQKNWEQLFNERYTSICSYSQIYRDYYRTLSQKDDCFTFMDLSYIVDALLTMNISTKNDEYLHDAMLLINNVIGSAKVTKNITGDISPLKDNYLGWISRTPNYAYNDESILYEGHIFKYVAQTLYEVKKSGWVTASSAHQDWYNNTLAFLEKNLWQKWIDRSMRIYSKPYTRFMGKRAHMASHWAYIALILEKISANATIRTQAREVINMYNVLLRRNLRPNVKYADAYQWNSTWDDVTGTQGEKDVVVEMQDVSHGNHVLDYIAASRTLGNTDWTDLEIKKFCNTVIYVLYNSSNMTFHDNVNGTDLGTGRGNFQSDGWLKLSRFSMPVDNLYKEFCIRNKAMIRKMDMELQFYSNVLYTNALSQQLVLK